MPAVTTKFDDKDEPDLVPLKAKVEADVSGMILSGTSWRKVLLPLKKRKH